MGKQALEDLVCPWGFEGAGTACEGGLGLGEQGVSLVFGGAGTACEGEQGLGGQGKP